MILILHTVLLLFLFEKVEDVIGLPCLTNEAKEDFDKSTKDLNVVQSDIGTVLKTLETNHQQTITALESELKKTVSIMTNNVKQTTVVLKTNLEKFKATLNSIGQKIKKLDTDFKVLGKDVGKTKLIKADGHCYYFSPENIDWFSAERKCREIGGYLAKMDNEKEKNKIYSYAKKAHYWIGLTDLKEGEFRWSYDQSKAVIKAWYPGYGKRGTNYNCVALAYDRGTLKPFDVACLDKKPYICESNFCF
ncbi:C-type lectin domain family 10 member A-like [Mytilus edulis]|uniref:C-type lectin domain family 10 member A-like n=1 Tax=Mytilus edulis TaxID=6550 RepID=UPI0039EDEA9B